MSRAFAIRHAELSDAPAIAQLSSQFGYAGDVAAFTKRLDKMLKMPTHVVFVACDEDDVVHGYIAAEQRLTLVSGEMVEIVGLVVDEASRRNGAGRALVTAAELWAMRRGADALSVRSNVLREASHPFYLALEYEHAKTQHAYQRRLR